MPHPRALPLSRRGLLAAGGLAGLGALVTACGSKDGSGSSGKEGKNGGGAWSFTDDRKTKIDLGGRPERIVAYIGSAAALYDFGIDDQIVGVFGPTKLKNGKPDVQAGDIDVDKVTILGSAWGQFNVEKYASLNPQLLITNMYDPGALFYVPDDSKNKILALAPSAALTTGRVSMVEPIKRYAELAAALGADLNAKKVTDAKARFEAAAETLRKTVKSKKIKVMACSASADLFYVSSPSVNADLIYFRELGVDFVVPQKTDKGGYFESLSWENADKYGADLLFLDNRTATLQPKDLTAKPTWSKLPAVKAGQIVPWSSEPRFSYAGAAPHIEALTKAIQDAKKVS
ncbi:ABC transporter substrate-binding protein [Streptomyces sp. NBS 14/10]|uniref:ABC transporter substrate-binding protein n=1 Tax=Streptomyces sp. NBS 14/10 TaxID=1945643 RepID=UPI000B7F2700|nr:ABC transporter substrate-binding protein [Streptomyces sp. NBS 14/10]KAK1181559.1 ABC transporter substrate-binding protein [Streptomyces sp. NBS 14/10]NUP39262.1 ABC transporter substrate-binding protein [Streptomyces sp.]NUS89941.1 ABC transporter substrate-binding protein [Streptomyces sp.]